MAIIVEEYSKKLEQLKKGIITEEEWILYCQDLMCQVLEDTKDVLIRIKKRGD